MRKWKMFVSGLTGSVLALLIATTTGASPLPGGGGEGWSAAGFANYGWPTPSTTKQAWGATYVRDTPQTWSLGVTGTANIRGTSTTCTFSGTEYIFSDGRRVSGEVRKSCDLAPVNRGNTTVVNTTHTWNNPGGASFRNTNSATFTW